jgi:hypothetical protein
MDMERKHRQRAIGVLYELGPKWLKAGADCDRQNADERYWRGHVDFAIILLDRAKAAETLLEELKVGPLRLLD